MKVTLEHKRVGHDYEGRVVLEDGETCTPLITFTAMSFQKMISMFSVMLNRHPEAEVVMLRTERVGLLPVVLDEDMARLLRVDPVAAIRSMSHEPIRVDTRPRVAMPVLLRAGHDTLAEAFGDYVYIRRRNTKVESPFTGRWEEVCWSIGYTNLHGLLGFKVMYEIEEVNGMWMRIKTENLLRIPEGMPVEMANYYLPRTWNDSGPWISQEDLKKKYDAFQQERDKTCSKILETN